MACGMMEGIWMCLEQKMEVVTGGMSGTWVRCDCRDGMRWSLFIWCWDGREGNGEVHFKTGICQVGSRPSLFINRGSYHFFSRCETNLA